MNNNLAIIPARGGSKRIPKKNIKLFLNAPVIAYSIEIALKSGLFNEVMVSTDDPEIAGIAEKYGARIPFYRSNRTSDDHAILNDVLKEVISEYQKRNQNFDHICMILPTAPLIQLKHLIGGFKLLCDEPFDSVRPVVKYSYPIQRSFSMVNYRIEMFYPEYYESRSQDLKPAFHDAGQFYWIYKDKLLTDPRKGAILISELECQDIDSEEDWKLAELKYQLLHHKS